MFRKCQKYFSNRIYTSNNHWYHRIADLVFDNSRDFTAELQKNIIKHTRTYTTNVKKLKRLKNEIISAQIERHQILLKYIKKDMNKEKIRLNDVNQEIEALSWFTTIPIKDERYFLNNEQF